MCVLVYWSPSKLEVVSYSSQVVQCATVVVVLYNSLQMSITLPVLLPWWRCKFSGNKLLHLKPGRRLLLLEDSEEAPNVEVMSTNIGLEPSVPTLHSIVSESKSSAASAWSGGIKARDGIILAWMAMLSSSRYRVCSPSLWICL